MTFTNPAIHLPHRTTVSTPPRGEPLNDTEMARGIGRVLRELRKQRGLSLNDLAAASGVSTSMLSQMENGRSTPTIAVLWKIASAFDVPLLRFLQPFEQRGQATLRRRLETPIRASAQGRCLWRNLRPQSQPREPGFFEVTLNGGTRETLPVGPPGTWTCLTLTTGALVVAVGTQQYDLQAGDTLQLPSELENTLMNPGRDDACLFVVTWQRGGDHGR